MDGFANANPLEIIRLPQVGIIEKYSWVIIVGNDLNGIICINFKYIFQSRAHSGQQLRPVKCSFDKLVLDDGYRLLKKSGVMLADNKWNSGFLVDIICYPSGLVSLCMNDIRSSVHFEMLEDGACIFTDPAFHQELIEFRRMPSFKPQCRHTFLFFVGDVCLQTTIPGKFSIGDLRINSL